MIKFNQRWLRATRKSSNGGFTLIELLVSFTLFTVISTIAVGGFVRILKSQRQAAALLSVNSNSSLVLEEMSREIRTGTNFCDGVVTFCSSASQLSFINALGCQVTYAWNGSNGTIEKSDSCSGNTPRALTANDVNVHYLTFTLLGNKPNSNYPPRITILVGVSPTAAELQGSVTHLQTTISARQI